jgi:hypothetical protein
LIILNKNINLKLIKLKNNSIKKYPSSIKNNYKFKIIKSNYNNNNKKLIHLKNLPKHSYMNMKNVSKFNKINTNKNYNNIKKQSLNYHNKKFT